MNTKGSTETEGSSDSDEPDLDVDVVDVCNSNLVKFAGLWSAIDKKDGSHAQASIQCFKDGEFRQITWNRSFAYYDHVISYASLSSLFYISITECGCEVIFSDNYVATCFGNVLVSTQLTIYDAHSNALKDDGVSPFGFECNQELNANVAPNFRSSVSNIISYTLQDDGSLVTMVDPSEDDAFESFFTAFNGFTFWRVSQSVDALPPRPPAPPAPPAVIARNDFVSVPEGFVGGKDIMVLENDNTVPEGLELEVVAITNPVAGFCTISHDDNKVVQYFYPPGSSPFESASCEYEVCTVPSEDVPRVCDTATVDISIDSSPPPAPDECESIFDSIQCESTPGCRVTVGGACRPTGSFPDCESILDFGEGLECANAGCILDSNGRCRLANSRDGAN